ncbi:hypothetical protein OOT08_15210 [Leucobacter sp. M11]|nr:hypothetical protein [Leucobacter sp. M11]
MTLYTLPWRSRVPLPEVPVLLGQYRGFVFAVLLSVVIENNAIFAGFDVNFVFGGGKGNGPLI